MTHTSYYRVLFILQVAAAKLLSKPLCAVDTDDSALLSPEQYTQLANIVHADYGIDISDAAYKRETLHYTAVALCGKMPSTDKLVVELGQFFNDITSVAQLQDNLNETTSPGWKRRRQNFARAYMLEAAEIYDHLSWKWWKRQEIDVEQAFMEVVDMLHFWVSMWLQSGSPALAIPSNVGYMSVSIGKALDTIVSNASYASYMYEETLPIISVRDLFNTLAGVYTLTIAFGYTTQDIKNWYIGKCALNFFRQENGYKDGTYKKLWDGKEDNVYLVSHIKAATTGLTLEGVMAYLGAEYAKHNRAA